MVIFGVIDEDTRDFSIREYNKLQIYWYRSLFIWKNNVCEYCVSLVLHTIIGKLLCEL